MTRLALTLALALLLTGCGDAPSSVVYPHAIVNRGVSQAALQAMAHGASPKDGQLVLAGADVLRDTNPPRAVLHFAAEVGLTERQAQIVAHEVSHLTARLLGVPDRTHETDGGVIRGGSMRRALIVIALTDRDRANVDAQTWDPVGGSRTFTVELSPTGLTPATHRWCSWAMPDADFLACRAKFASLEYPLAHFEEWDMDSNRQRPGALLAALGLKPLNLR